MNAITILHNPRCSKSREALSLLKEAGIEPTIHRYLDNPLSQSALVELISKLKQHPREIIRAKEPAFKALDLDLKTADQSVLIDAIVNNPIIMERPIVFDAKRGMVARPPERVKELL